MLGGVSGHARLFSNANDLTKIMQIYLQGGVYGTSRFLNSKTIRHFGFTGIYSWADPDTQITYVFVSNRTYPTMDNNLLGSTDMRTVIQQAIYDARIY
jgi:beta-N-acetylhexosaminidase